MIKVLIADDENSLRFLISETLLLESNKFQLFEASDGDEALSKILSVKPDIVILDVMMPKLNGYQILEHLKSKQDYKPKIVMLTAKVQPEDVEKGLSMGATLYLSKPFSPLDLLDTIKKLL
jgi:DNA-binding response OmpR family regulator